MKYIKFILDDDHYTYEKSNSLEISTLGLFLKIDTPLFIKDYKKWALADPNTEYGISCSGNYAYLENNSGTISIEDLCDEDNPPTKLKISREQFIKILNEWDQRVVNADPRPKEVIVKQDGDQFFIETND